MKYWLIPVLICAGASQAHADFLGMGSQPGLIGVNIHNPLVSATAGVQFGPHNNLDVQQHSLANFVGVQQVAIGKPGSSLSNNAGVTQVGAQSYTGLGQHIETVPSLPVGLGAP